jgi:hypothetical protein
MIVPGIHGEKVSKCLRSRDISISTILTYGKPDQGEDDSLDDGEILPVYAPNEP